MKKVGALEIGVCRAVRRSGVFAISPNAQEVGSRGGHGATKMIFDLHSLLACMRVTHVGYSVATRSGCTGATKMILERHCFSVAVDRA